MVLTRPQKEQLVSKMTENLKTSKSTILVNFQGLKVNELQDFKRKLKEKGIGFQIIKNSLFKIALKNANRSIDESLLDQPVGIVWGAEDEVEPAKLTAEFKKAAEKLEIIGGFVDEKFAEENLINRLSALPARQELYARLVGSLGAPMYRLINVLQSNLRSLVYILKEYQDSKQ